MGKLIHLKHPLLEHKLTHIREKTTDTKTFRENVAEISALMAYEITRDLATRPQAIETPLKAMTGHVLDKAVVLVPILRAGLGMVEGIHRLIPTAKVGHIGLYRDEETLQPQCYYVKFPPDVKDATVLLLDPMLATGGSVVAAIDALREKGVQDIRFVGIVGCPEGVRKLQEKHPDVDIYLAALDERLNDQGYIEPGLGDCGDRLFGTK